MILRGAHANIPPFVDFAPADAVGRMKTEIVYFPTTFADCTVWRVAGGGILRVYSKTCVSCSCYCNYCVTEKSPAAWLVFACVVVSTCVMVLATG